MDKIFRKAAKSALFSWGREDGLEDLVNYLWVWYLERPAAQRKLKKADASLRHTLIRDAALQILRKEALADDISSGRSLYSSENVKKALLGESNNWYLLDILPMAMRVINDDYAEAIRSRYEDGASPQGKSGQNALFRAHKALTEEVNVIAITAGIQRDGDGNLIVKEGPGSRHAVFPETRRSNYGHADPTANIAIMLIEHPELRDDYYEEMPLQQFLKGKDAQPVRLGV